MKMSDRAKLNTRKGILFAIILILVFLWLLPILFLLLISFKTSGDYAVSQLWELPQKFAFFSNIRYVLIETNLIRPFLNSLMYAVISSLIAIFFSSLAAYGITKLKIKGSFIIFILIWSGMIFPVQIYLIPLYKAYLTINLYNTQIGMILIYTAIIIPFCVFVFRNYFLTLPDDFQEAAKIDGCSNFQIYARMLLPNSLGPIAILFLFQGSFIWNDLILGMALSSSNDVRPVMNSLALLNAVYSGTNVPAVMAGSLISSLPIIILYLALQKYFIQGLRIQAAGR
ncbi:MAG: carbohydrate ABC transporter permease [Actinomycetota bacterium]|nr:carbohydrate ABC transporter permease [Actinomycetota bacterium]